jgi:hypothetical protein
MKRILIVYSNVPEGLVFVVREVNDADFDLLMSFNGHYVGMGHTDKDEEFMRYFGEDSLPQNDDHQPPLTSQFFDGVIHCGFIL